MKNLDDVISEIESRLDEKDEVRELAIKSSRTMARLAGSAIQGMHRGEDVQPGLQETREEVQKLRSLLDGHPDLIRAGFVENAMQEACEAFLVHAILSSEPLPTPKECGVTDTAYLLGLGDVVGELRRFALTALRGGGVSAGSPKLQRVEGHPGGPLRLAHPPAHGGLQDVVHQVGGGLDFLQLPQPAPAAFGLGEGGSAEGALGAVGLEALLQRPAQRPVQGLSQQGLKLAAGHPGFAFPGHLIHLPIGTRKQARKFRSSPVDAGLDGPLRHP